MTCHGLPRPVQSQQQGGRPPQIVNIDLDKPAEVEYVSIPIPYAAPSTRLSSLKGLFVDPTGKHAIVGTHSGDNYYLYLGPLPPNQTRKPKQMTKFKGAVIESVAWNQTATSTGSYSTREILVGTALGQILETTLVDSQLSESTSFSIPGRTATPERYFKHMFSLPERVPVTGLHFEVWNKKVAVLATTQTRIYQFVGTPSSSRRDDDTPMFDSVFTPYSSSDAQPSTTTFLLFEYN